MKKTVRRQTMQFTKEEDEMIMKYPGKGFAKKLHNLLRVHQLLMNEIDTAEVVEKLLQPYLREFYPELEEEIKIRREEAKKLQDATANIKEVVELFDKIKAEISNIADQAEIVINANLASCVTVRKHKELPEKIKKMIEKAQEGYIHGEEDVQTKI